MPSGPIAMISKRPEAPKGKRAVFGPWRPRWRTSLGFLAIGFYLAVVSWPKFAVHPRPTIEFATLHRALYALILLPLGIWLTVIDIRRRPKLIIGRRRLVVKGIFVTRAIRWDRLGAFHLVHAGAIKSRKLFTARAPILHPNNRDGKRRFFCLPDMFAEPLPAILRAIPPRGTVLTKWPEQPATTPVCGQATPPPFWSIALLPGCFFLYYVAELLFPIAPLAHGVPRPETLVALGGATASLINMGQWHRLFVAPFLHAGPLPLCKNMLAGAMIARLAERLLGRNWTWCLFSWGAVAGSLTFYYLSYDPNAVIVGGVGAVIAPIAAMAICCLRLPAGRRRIALGYRLAEISLIATLPVSSEGSAMHVGVAGTFGGALFGIVCGLLMLLTWEPDKACPRFSVQARVGWIVAVALIVLSTGVATIRYHNYKLLSLAMPEARIPQMGRGLDTKAATLSKDYPRDPRPHLYLAAIALKKRDKVTAEAEARLAFQLAQAGRSVYSTATEITSQALLAAVLFENGKKAEAQSLASPVCLVMGETDPASPVLARLQRDKLCASKQGR